MVETEAPTPEIFDPELKKIADTNREPWRQAYASQIPEGAALDRVLPGPEPGTSVLLLHDDKGPFEKTVPTVELPQKPTESPSKTPSEQVSFGWYDGTSPKKEKRGKAARRERKPKAPFKPSHTQINKDSEEGIRDMHETATRHHSDEPHADSKFGDEIQRERARNKKYGHRKTKGEVIKRFNAIK